MKRLQHSVSVEQAVMSVLQEQLRPSCVQSNVIDYVNYDIDPAVYSSGDQFKRDYSYISFLRKWKGHKDKALRPNEAAFSTWLEAEKMCFRTNMRLETEASTGLYSVAPAAIVAAQRKIAQILGRLDIDRISELCRFGNGATFDLKRGSTHADKSVRPSITFEAIPWVCKVLTGDAYLGGLVGGLNDLTIVRSNRMVMVAKTAKTHRPIAAEPTLNSYVQQGFGRYIRQRLKRFGVDLNDQTINQGHAQLAKDLGLSTIDLSSASDTLCINLVKLLLPPEWYEALYDLRCQFTTFQGKCFKLSKFSSMGNAFTFELESLIFYALISAVCTGDVTSVYGDDLVVRDCDYAQVVEILTWAGFKINEHKSYTAGSSFFESCGKHYFDGEEVTPCFQKDVCRRPHDYVRLHNRLVRAGMRLNLRKEFNAAASVVRERSRILFGKQSPGVGPVVQYDEYFIKESYSWASDREDRVRIRSAVSLPLTRKCDEDWKHIAYFGRKLRCSGFLNPDPQGSVSENSGSKLLVVEKYHWRSATPHGDALWSELPETWE